MRGGLERSEREISGQKTEQEKRKISPTGKEQKEELERRRLTWKGFAEEERRVLAGFQPLMDS